MSNRPNRFSWETRRNAVATGSGALRPQKRPLSIRGLRTAKQLNERSRCFGADGLGLPSSLILLPLQLRLAVVRGAILRPPLSLGRWLVRSLPPLRVHQTAAGAVASFAASARDAGSLIDILRTKCAYVNAFTAMRIAPRTEKPSERVDTNGCFASPQLDSLMQHLREAVAVTEGEALKDHRVTAVFESNNGTVCDPVSGTYPEPWNPLPRFLRWTL